MKNIVIIGVSGRMGKYVHSILDGRDGFNVVAGVNKSSQFARVEIFRYLKDVLTKNHVDLVIDFSNVNSVENIEIALENKIPVISGTTGYSDKEKEFLIKFAKEHNTNLMMVSNFAYGASIMYRILKDINYMFEKKDILEVHHVNKKDKPSGTAKEYAKVMNIDYKKVQSIRLNDVIASHEAIFDSPGEKLIIRHEIYHRDAFLKGLLNTLDIIFKRKVWISNLEEYNDLR